MDRRRVVVIVVLFSLVLLYAGLNMPITKQVPYQCEECYFVDIPYQSPVYKTIFHKEPLYDTVHHTDPVYETLYNVEIRDESAFGGDEVYTRNNVYKYDMDYTGTDFWGNSEYKCTLYYYLSVPDGRKSSRVYYEIDDWDFGSYEAIISYNEWSEEVIVGYDRTSSQVIDYYETKHRKEKRHKMVTKYKSSTRYVWWWILYG